MKFIEGNENSPKGQAFAYWPVNCTDKENCKWIKEMNFKPKYIAIMEKIELGKRKTEFGDFKQEEDICRGNIPIPLPVENKESLEKLINKVKNNFNEVDIIESEEVKHCYEAIFEIEGFLAKYSSMYAKSKSTECKIDKIMEEIEAEKKRYAMMGMPEKLTLLCNLTGKIFDSSITKKEMEYAEGEIERLTGSFEKKYNANEFVKALKVEGKNKMGLCDLYLKKYFYIANDNFEGLEGLSKQIIEIENSVYKEKK